MNLSQIDLNLLVILKQLLEEQHVTNTALTLNMSQPTVSRALNKSRQLFSDPLLVRSNTGYSLTPKAESIKKDLNSVLSRLENLVEGDAFDPKTSSKTLRLFGLAPQMDLFIPHFRNFHNHVFIQNLRHLHYVLDDLGFDLWDMLNAFLDHKLWNPFSDMFIS